MTDLARWRGLVTLVRDAVEHGSRAVERLQLETAGRPFAVLDAIPGVAEPARVVHVVYDASVSSVHAIVRGVAQVVATTIDAALIAADERPRGEG